MSAGAGQLVACAVKQVLVAVSQHAVPDVGGGQLFWHCALVAQLEMHTSVAKSSVGAGRKFARSEVWFVCVPSLPQPAAPRAKVTAATVSSDAKALDALRRTLIFAAFTHEGLHYVAAGPQA